MPPLFAVELPPTSYEYTWLERQQINFENQQLVVDLEPAVGAQNWVEAEKILTQALQNDPESNALKGRLLTVLAEAGKNKEALELAYPLLKEYPRHLPLILYIGNVETKAGNRDAAAKAWTYALALPETSKEDRLFASKSLYYEALKKKDLAVALKASETWASLERSYQSNLQYASALWKTGNRDEGIRVLEKANRLAGPKEKETAQFFLAYTLMKANRPAEAQPLFRRLATDSEDSGARRRASMQLAYSSIASGDMKSAQQWLDAAALDGPKDEEWKKLYSETILAEGDVEKTLAAAGTFFDADQANFLTLLSFQFLRNGYEGLAYHFIRRAADRPGLPEDRKADYWANRAYMAENQDNYQDALDSIDLALTREPNRVDWKIVRVRSLYMLGETDMALDEAIELEKEVDALPTTPENTRILNEAIDLIANSHLEEEEYRQTLRTAEQFLPVYSGSGLYRSQALAYYHLGDYDESNAAFEEFFRRQPDPDPVTFVEYGYLQEKRGEWELAIGAFTHAVQSNPYDLRSWETLTYVLVKAVENDDAVVAAKETVALRAETLPSADDDEQEEIQQAIIDYKTLIGNLERTWGFQAFANYNEFIPGGNDVFVSRNSGLPAELGAQISYRPPIIGFRDYRTFDLFARVLAQFDDNTIRTNDDSWQGGIGGEWKPFKTLNYVTSLEYLFKIGDDAREGWLWRNRASYAYGDYPREDEAWWPTLVLYGEAAWYWDRDWNEQELSLFTEDRLGISWKIRDNLSLTFPQIQGTIRYLIRGYTDRSSYIFGGFGANLRLAEGETEDSTNDWYIDFFLHYDWGRFLNEEGSTTGSRFDGWAAGLRFYR